MSSAIALLRCPQRPSIACVARLSRGRRSARRPVALSNAISKPYHAPASLLFHQEDLKASSGLFACTAFSVVCFVFIAPALGDVIDIIGKGQAASVGELVKAVGTLGAVYLGSNLSLAAQVALAQSMAEGIAGRLRKQLFSKLLARETSFFSTVKTGELTSWLGQDIELLQATVAKLLGARGVRAAFETIGIIIMLCYLCWPLACALLLTTPLLTPLVSDLSVKIRECSSNAQAAAATTSAAADEIIENARLIKVFGAQSVQNKRYNALADTAGNSAIKVVKLQGFLDAASRGRNTLCVLVTLGLGAHLALAGQVTVGVCYSFFVYSFSFAFALGNLAAAAGDFSRAQGAISRTMGVLQKVNETREAGQVIENFTGEIEFRDVCFENPEWGDWKLKNISFIVPKGTTLYLMGPSGGGKSTITALLLGLLKPTSGDILIDGVPLRLVDPTWWRRQLGVVEQFPGLLTGRVRDVISYSRSEVTGAEVERAADIANLPRGLSLDAKSDNLSGGQKQRLALARAVLSKPKVLVLDESTSMLDVETAARVESSLSKMKDCSKIVVTHKVPAASDVLNGSQILVVSDGELIPY